MPRVTTSKPTYLYYSANYPNLSLFCTLRLNSVEEAVVIKGAQRYNPPIFLSCVDISVTCWLEILETRSCFWMTNPVKEYTEAKTVQGQLCLDFFQTQWVKGTLDRNKTNQQQFVLSSVGWEVRLHQVPTVVFQHCVICNHWCDIKLKNKK